MRVGILALDPLGAGQISAIVSAAGHRPVSFRHGADLAGSECAVALVDCEHPDFEGLASCASQGGLRVLAFSQSMVPGGIAALAERHGVPALTLPVAPEHFRERLERIADEWATEQARTFTDAAGHQWYARELPPIGVAGRRVRSLLFYRGALQSGDHVARRVWAYPDGWREMGDAELEALAAGPPGRPPGEEA